MSCSPVGLVHRHELIAITLVDELMQILFTRVEAEAVNVSSISPMSCTGQLVKRFSVCH